MRQTFLHTSIILVSTFFALIVVEIATRVVSGAEVLTLRNWIASRSHLLNVHTVNDYSSVTGWRLKEGIRSTGFNTGPYGLRFTETEPNPDSAKILAVGDSFTAGSEVTDEFSWPAHLENLLGTQVLNGGVGAFGTDQIVLQAEELLEKTDPDILVVGFLENDIYRSQYSVFGGGPKPYFTVRDGALVGNNLPVPLNVGLLPDSKGWARVIGHSLFATRLLEATAPALFLSLHGPVYEKISNDPVKVSCLLLQRLAKKAQERDIRLIHLMQYGGGLVTQREQPNTEARVVTQCASASGYQVVDEFSALRKVFEEDPESLKLYYNMSEDGTVFGHMSSLGNRFVAGLVQLAIENPQTDIGTGAFEDEVSLLRETVEGDSINLYGISEILEKPGRASLANASLQLAEKNGTFGKVYSIEATQGQGEHYLSTGHLPTTPGPHVASVYVRPLKETGVRLQILDSSTKGAIADFDFVKDNLQLLRLSDGRSDAWMQSIGDGWYRIFVSSDLSTHKVYSILQFKNSAGTSFLPDGEVFEFSGMRVEKGDVPSDPK